MPVSVKKMGDKYRVVGPDGKPEKNKKGTPVDGGGFDSRQQALKQMSAINMHKLGLSKADEMSSSPIVITSDGTTEGTQVLLHGNPIQFSSMSFHCCNDENYPSCEMSMTIEDSDESGVTVRRSLTLRKSDSPAVSVQAAKKLDPNAEVRNRGNVVFPANSPKVSDNKDHFPINNPDQARNALSRVAQYSSVPSWYKGSLKELQSAVRSAVSRKYSNIKVSK